ncbi:MAG TPA: nuclear transport factor 2 family protein [Candidatus Dormibacteraeota bacterium]|nr:nuclear transport factor 2 family protein [Candidatus Dormibacteraeota bacterium]
MKRFTTCAFVIGALCAGLISARTNSPLAAAQDDPAALRADHAFVQAVAKADKTALNSLLDAQFTWTDAAGKTLTRRQALSATPKPGITDESTARIVSHQYGRVEMVQAHSGRANIMRLWVKRPAGWRLLVYQEATLRDGPSEPIAKTNGTCVNPCKTLPYKPRNQNERDVLKSYMALQTATVEHNVENWGKHVADEFSAASSNSNQLLNKKGRMADLGHEKMAGYAPMPIVSMKVFDFGNTAILISHHVPPSGRPMHMLRLWIKRNGQWQEVAAYQTKIAAVSAKR